MVERVERVLFVSTSFPRFASDFSGSFVFRFAKYLVRDGVQVTALVPGEPDYPARENMEGVQVYRFPYFYPRRYQSLTYLGISMLDNARRSWLAALQLPLLFMATIGAIIRYQDRFNLIHGHWVPTASAALLARPFSRKKPPIVLTNWGSDTRLLASWLTRWTIRHVDGCISTAVETDEHLRALGRDEFRQIMAPIDEERFSRDHVKPDARQELGVPEDVPVITFVGRLDEFKDPLTFIRACAILKQRGVSLAGLVAGDGDLMPTCQQEVQRLGLDGVVRLLGTRTDPERLFRIATAQVHVSPVENTWANAIAEAMFMDVPVVLSNAGYTERLFTHEKDCLLVPVKNPPMLADALQRLLQDRPLRARLVAGARRLLRKYRKDSESIVHETRAYYDEVFKRRKRG